jgi:hypothetical protein
MAESKGSSDETSKEKAALLGRAALNMQDEWTRQIT